MNGTVKHRLSGTRSEHAVCEFIAASTALAPLTPCAQGQNGANAQGVNRRLHEVHNPWADSNVSFALLGTVLAGSFLAWQRARGLRVREQERERSKQD